MGKKKQTRNITRKSRTPAMVENDFDIVVNLITAAQRQAVAAVNTTLIDLYWKIGEYISQQIAARGWGKGTVEICGG